MATKEIIFEGIPGSRRVSGKELHFKKGDGNQVSWQVVPRGEQGHSVIFEDPQKVEHFVQSYAARLGFTKRLEDSK